MGEYTPFLTILDAECEVASESHIYPIGPSLELESVDTPSEGLKLVLAQEKKVRERRCLRPIDPYWLWS